MIDGVFLISSHSDWLLEGSGLDIGSLATQRRFRRWVAQDASNRSPEVETLDHGLYIDSPLLGFQLSQTIDDRVPNLIADTNYHSTQRPVRPSPTTPASKVLQRQDMLVYLTLYIPSPHLIRGKTSTVLSGTASSVLNHSPLKALTSQLLSPIPSLATCPRTSTSQEALRSNTIRLALWK